MFAFGFGNNGAARKQAQRKRRPRVTVRRLTPDLVWTIEALIAAYPSDRVTIQVTTWLDGDVTNNTTLPLETAKRD